MANSALVRMLGFASEEELCAEGAAGLYVEPSERENGKKILEQTGRLVNAELHLRRKDGSHVFVLENSRAVKDENGRVLYYQGTLTDITDRKEAEQALRTARDHALEASRMKSQFLANISHELRTPLNAVLGMSQLLLSTPSTAAVQECAETIHLSARILLDHITEILDYSRVEAGQLELESFPFDVREQIHQAATMLAARAADKGLRLLAWAEPGVPAEVRGDPARLQQVLVNLLSNAVKFTEQGEVELRVSNVGSSEGSCVLRFEVRDTGIGILQDAREVIFEPFRQADGSTTRRYGGTGLGLSIVREILAQMGSHIELQSEPGAGSRFSFEIEVPVGMQDSVSVIDGDIAVLEPNATARQAIETWLRAWGAGVISLTDCDALDRMLGETRHGKALRAVVVDQAAVEECGDRILRLLSDPAVEACPLVVLLSGWDGRTDWLDSSSNEGKAVLRMPLSENELLRTLERSAAPSRGASLQMLAQAVQSSTERARLLIAEDNVVNQTVVRRMVEKLGYTAELVANGREAVEAFDRGHFDLVLMDCQMPEMDGFRATEAIRAAAKNGRRVPIIALTAHASAGDRQACLSAGMDDYLSKPLLLNDLAAMLTRWTQPRGTDEPDGEPMQSWLVRG